MFFCLDQNSKAKAADVVVVVAVLVVQLDLLRTS